MEQIIMESVVPWTVDGVRQTSFLCTPEHVQELAYGYLINQHLVDGLQDVASVTGDAQGVAVCLTPGATLHPEDILDRLAGCKRCESTLTVSLTELRERCLRLLGDETYYGTHRLVLSHGNEEIYREDAGRHNAADKAVACGLHNGWRMSDCLLGATGRISIEMLAKAAVAGIPVFFSRKYPSDLAIAWAERLNIALVARAHGDAPTVYGAAWRIKG